jgi:hypothetical protein
MWWYHPLGAGGLHAVFKMRRLSDESISFGGRRADAAVFFSCSEFTEAQGSRVWNALIDLVEGEISLLNDVLPYSHRVDGFVCGQDERVLGLNSDAELTRGCLVVAVAETSADASAVYDVEHAYTVPRQKNRFLDHALPEG